MLDYPQTLPLDEIKAIIELVKNREVKTNLPVFAKNAWVVQGFVQKMVLGNTLSSEPNFDLFTAGEFDGVAALEKCIASEASVQLTLPWALILEWLLKLLLDSMTGK